MGKRRQRRQDVLILTETNSAAESQLEAEVGYAVSPSTFEAWGLNSDQQAEDDNSGGFIQVVSERSFIPVQVFNLDKGKKNIKILGDNVNAIAAQKEDEELMFLERRRDNDRRFLWLSIIALILAAILAVIIMSNMEGGMSCGSPALQMALPAFVVSAWRFVAGERKVTPDTVNAMIFQDKKKKRIFKDIQESKLPTEARPRDYGRRRLYIINESENGDYYAILPPERIEKDKSPKDLYQALNCEEEVEETYKLDPSTWERFKMTFLYVLVSIELAMIFIFGTMVVN